MKEVMGVGQTKPIYSDKKAKPSKVKPKMKQLEALSKSVKK